VFPGQGAADDVNIEHCLSFLLEVPSTKTAENFHEEEARVDGGVCNPSAAEKAPIMENLVINHSLHSNAENKVVNGPPKKKGLRQLRTNLI